MGVEGVSKAELVPFGFICMLTELQTHKDPFGSNRQCLETPQEPLGVPGPHFGKHWSLVKVIEAHVTVGVSDPSTTWSHGDIQITNANVCKTVFICIILHSKTPGNCVSINMDARLRTTSAGFVNYHPQYCCVQAQLINTLIDFFCRPPPSTLTR